MSLRHFVIFLIYLNFSNASSYSHCIAISFDYYVNIVHEMKTISKTLSDFKSDVDRKFIAMDSKMSETTEQKIPELFDALLNKQINTFGNKNFDMEKMTHDKLSQLETNLHNKLVKYIDRKLDALKDDIFQKIDVKEQNTPENTEIARISTKLDVLNNVQHDSNDIINKTLLLINETITTKIETINENVKDIYNFIQNTVYIKRSTKNSECNLGNEFTNTVYKKLDEMKKNITEINEKMDTLQKSASSVDIGQGYVPHSKLRCKKEEGYYKPHKMDSERLNHVTLNKDESGDLIYFEMHIGIKGPPDGTVALFATTDSEDNSVYYEFVIGADFNSLTRIQGYDGNGYVVHEARTPDILSLTDFKYFYVKIENGTMELGEQGSSSAIVSHYDPKVKEINYFSFSSWRVTEVVEFLYDC